MLHIYWFTAILNQTRWPKWYGSKKLFKTTKTLVTDRDGTFWNSTSKIKWLQIFVLQKKKIIKDIYATFYFLQANEASSSIIDQALTSESATVEKPYQRWTGYREQSECVWVCVWVCVCCSADQISLCFPSYSNKGMAARQPSHITSHQASWERARDVES